MAYLREGVLRRQRLCSTRLQIRSWAYSHVDFLSNHDHACNILRYRFGRARIDEEQASLQAECAVHGTQSILDDDQWRFTSLIHRAVGANGVEAGSVLRHL